MDVEKIFQATKSKNFLEKFPLRNPILFTVEAIKDMVKNKSFCDLGCAAGDLVKEISFYAKESCGIDNCERGVIGKKMELI